MKKSRGRKVALAAATALLLLIPVVLWTSWAHILFLIDFESLGRNEQGYPEYRHREAGIIFVHLPGGKVLMGSPEDEEDRQKDEGAVHEVTLSPFLIAKFEVTQKQWTDVMAQNQIGFAFPRDDNPAENISWNDIQDFEVVTGLGLPTEAQWEYACRAGTPRRFSGSGNLHEMGWYAANSGGQTNPVGLKRPNHFGLHDMHGNVSEWCEDVYDKTFYSNDVPDPDPLSIGGSEARVNRGGDWDDGAQACRSANRVGSAPTNRFIALGFRPTAQTP